MDAPNMIVPVPAAMVKLLPVPLMIPLTVKTLVPLLVQTCDTAMPMGALMVTALVLASAMPILPMLPALRTYPKTGLDPCLVVGEAGILVA